MPALAASVVPKANGNWATSSTRCVGRLHRLAARRAKALMLLRTNWLSRTRLPFALFCAHCRALNSPPREPGGMATETNRSWPKMLRQRFALTRWTSFSSTKMSCSSCLLAVRGKFDGLSHSVHDPAEYELARSPASVAFQELLQRLAWLRSDLRPLAVVPTLCPRNAAAGGKDPLAAERHLVPPG
jgi:hypothetical protein